MSKREVNISTHVHVKATCYDQVCHNKDRKCVAVIKDDEKR